MREAFSPLWGFLYGWTLFTVIQRGTIAAVAVASARFSRVLWPGISEERYLIPPVRVSTEYTLSLSTAQLLGILVIALLTWTNSCGREYGKIVQNIFATAKTGALLGLVVGLFLGWNATAVESNFGDLWTPHGYVPIAGGLDATSASGLFAAILCGPDLVAVCGQLLTWHHLYGRRRKESEAQSPPSRCSWEPWSSSSSTCLPMWRVLPRFPLKTRSTHLPTGSQPQCCKLSFRGLEEPPWRLPP